MIGNTGFDSVTKLFEADRAAISAKAAGSAPATTAILIAIGTITTVAPTWLMTRLKPVASKATMSCSTKAGTASGRMSSDCCASQAAVPVLSIAQPSGSRQAITNTVFQLMAP